MNNSFCSQSSLAQGQFVDPDQINKISIRTKQSSIQVQIPFLQQSDRNVYIECFSVFDTQPTGTLTDCGKQFLLFCDSATGYYRFNGKQTLLTAISNWDGDNQKQLYSLMNQVPFKVKRGDNFINFVITQATQDTNLYPAETEGDQVDINQTRYLFNIVLNIIEDI